MEIDDLENLSSYSMTFGKDSKKSKARKTGNMEKKKI